MYSYGPPHMPGQKQDDQHEHTFSSYVRIRDIALKTCQRGWTIGKSGDRGSGIFMLVTRRDDDDDIGTINLVFIVILTTFQPIFPLAFIMCLMSNSGTHKESWIEHFIRTTVEHGASSINHDLYIESMFFFIPTSFLRLNLQSPDDFPQKHFPTKRLIHWAMFE